LNKPLALAGFFIPFQPIPSSFWSPHPVSFNILMTHQLTVSPTKPPPKLVLYWLHPESTVLPYQPGYNLEYTISEEKKKRQKGTPAHVKNVHE